MFYNSTYRSTIKCTPFDAQNQKIDHNKTYEELERTKKEKNRKGKQR